MLYPSELLARSRRSSMVLKDATSGNFHEQLYSIWYVYSIGMNGERQGAFSRGSAVQPFARDLISLASFSISSVFLSMPREST